MRYSVMSFVYLKQQITVFSPNLIRRRFIYDTKTIDEITSSKTVIGDGIIIASVIDDYTRHYSSRGSVFIPETHHLFNLPLIDNYIDNYIGSGSFEGITQHFTNLIKQTVGVKYFKQLTKGLFNKYK